MKKYNGMPRCILALSWRDIKFPDMGGAEIYTHEMLKRAAERGIEIVHFAPGCKGIAADEYIDKIHYIRQGSLKNVIMKAKKYYKQREKEIDYVIDQCNTFRFFTKFWVPKDKRIFLIFQLTREIWDINMRFPFSKIGKIMETPLLRMNKEDITITESESTKRDLIEAGFLPNKIKIIPVGLQAEFLAQPLEENSIKLPIFIYVGRYSKYKGMDATIEAFGILKQRYAKSKLWIVGKKDDNYIESVLINICEKYHLKIGDSIENDIVTWGFVSEEKKYELQKNAKALIFPSIREGWGMTISETGALGTPSITYDAPGTRDAVDFGRAGYMCKENTVEAIVECMEEVLCNDEKYREIQIKAWEFANKLDFNNTGQLFLELLIKLEEKRR